MNHIQVLALPDAEFINAFNIIDRLSLIKDEGTINRFREASRIVDIGQSAVHDAVISGGYKGMTETEIAGLAAYYMRKAGSEWEWSYTGGNEIAYGYRTDFAGGACTQQQEKNCSLESIGFRYEAPIVIRKDDCELLAKYPMEIIEI